MKISWKTNLLSVALIGYSLLQSGIALAGNPASVEYVDAQDEKLQAQINALTLQVGDYHGGGVIIQVYLDANNEPHGLIAAVEDVAQCTSGCVWDTTTSCLGGGACIQTNATAGLTVPFGGDGYLDSGQNNTSNIAVAFQNVTCTAGTGFICAPAAYYATQYSNPNYPGADGTWYLPSLTELGLLYTLMGPINDTAQQHCPSSNPDDCLFNIEAAYWSSTENDQLCEPGSYCARDQDFGNGSQYNGYKLNSLSVRAVRAF